MNSEEKPKKPISRSNRQITVWMLVVAVFAVGFLLGSQANPLAAVQVDLNQEEKEQFNAFWQAYSIMREDYLEPVPADALVEGAISGMLEAAGDQYTGYMARDVYSLLNEDISGEIQGIGVIISTQENTGAIEVMNILKDTPAERAGVLPGDIFIAVDGEDVLGYTQLELAGVVRGPRGTSVEITFLREEDLVDFSIERDRIPIPTVEFGILNDGIGVVRLYDFSPQSRPQFDEAIATMGRDNLNALILDLRGNPGGTLDSAIDITSAFLEEGVILREEFAEGRTDQLQTNGNYANLNIPLVILVDENSASASELVSGALQDYGLATIIGETTFGKGTVQTWQGLSNGGGVRVTIARWLTPNGNWIHKQGIEPNISVEWDPETVYFLDLENAESVAGDPQLQAALSFLQETIATQ